MFSGREDELHFVHEQVADIVWILLLCAFSLLVRFRRRKAFRVYLMAIVFFLFTLAALHSHPLWNSRKLASSDVVQAQAVLTRVVEAQSQILEAGLRLDDVVTAMAFDPDGNLWLATPSNGPYCYQVHSNEVENLLRPDVVYGFFPDKEGMWVLTSGGAFLYRGPEVVQAVRFPEGVIPLCGLRVSGRRLFGTTRGLFTVPEGRSQAQPEGSQQDRVTALRPIGSSVLVVSDSGLLRWTQRGTALFAAIHHRSVSGLAGEGKRLYAATSEDGILSIHPWPWSEIRFAVPELNMISAGAITEHKGMPCFGTYGGSVVYRSGSGWRRIATGEFPVTALASNGETLYAWSGGRLLDVTM